MYVYLKDCRLYAEWAIAPLQQSQRSTMTSAYVPINIDQGQPNITRALFVNYSFLQKVRDSQSFDPEQAKAVLCQYGRRVPFTQVSRMVIGAMAKTIVDKKQPPIRRVNNKDQAKVEEVDVLIRISDIKTRNSGLCKTARCFTDRCRSHAGGGY